MKETTMKIFSSVPHRNVLGQVMSITLESKGGVGKSSNTQLVRETLLENNPSVVVAETDTSNSSMAMITQSEQLLVRKIGFEGQLFELAERMENKEAYHVVIDTGARDEALIHPFLGELATKLRSFDASLVIIRPITLSTFVVNNAATFCEDVMTPEMCVIFVRNLSQGRVVDDFDDWQNGRTRKEMLARGVVECDMQDAGARWSDEATGLNLSFADVVHGRFEKAGNNIETAKRIFDRKVQLFLARWLLRQTNAFRRAFETAISRKQAK